MNEPQDYKWFLYGKYKGQKTFQLIDWSKGTQTKRRVYASRFTDADRERLEKIDFPANPDWQFEFRAI